MLMPLADTSTRGSASLPFGVRVCLALDAPQLVAG